jgi:rare lipoprotein A
MVRAMFRPVAFQAAGGQPRLSKWSPAAVLPMLLLALAALLLTGCSSTPKSGSAVISPGKDGPMADTPADLHKTPDAEPRVEAIRQGGPNKPYTVNGRSYTPETRDVAVRQTGLASWYGRKFHGRRTASGEVYNMYAMTAAHPTLPIPSYARVRNPKNGREVVLRVNDRGPFHSDRIIDLSYTAALKLDLLRGVAPVEVERITYEDIRTGAWRRGSVPGDDADGNTVAAAAAVPAVAVDPPAVPAAPIRSETTPSRAFTTEARGWWVQLGAFRERGGAESFQQRVASELDWIAPLLAIFNEAPMHRLQAGPYASRDEAASAAERVRAELKLVPVIVERR